MRHCLDYVVSLNRCHTVSVDVSGQDGSRIWIIRALLIPTNFPQFIQRKSFGTAYELAECRQAACEYLTCRSLSILLTWCVRTDD